MKNALLLITMTFILSGCTEKHTEVQSTKSQKENTNSLPNEKESCRTDNSENDNSETVLYDYLSKQPVVELTGVVSSMGAGRLKIGRDDLWTFDFTFVAWRIGSGPIRKESINIRRKVSEEQIKKIRGIGADMIIKVYARVSDDSVCPKPQGLFEEFIKTENRDAELNEYLAKLLIPITYEDTVFGTLKYDRRLDWYEANVKWMDNSSLLFLKADYSNILDTTLQNAHQLWKNQNEWNQRILDFTAIKLLPLKNQNWLDNDEKDISKEQFKKMLLQSIQVNSDGSFEFWYKDGGLFWGHNILVKGSLKDGLTDAEIEG